MGSNLIFTGDKNKLYHPPSHKDVQGCSASILSFIILGVRLFDTAQLGDIYKRLVILYIVFQKISRENTES